MNRYRLPTGPAQFKPPAGALESANTFNRKPKAAKVANKSGIPLSTKGPNK